MSTNTDTNTNEPIDLRLIEPAFVGARAHELAGSGNLILEATSGRFQRVEGHSAQNSAE